MRLVGRPSRSILDTPRVLGAPRAPYHPAPGAPYRRAPAEPASGGPLDLVELPMAVTPLLRLPVIGTSLITAPAWLRRHLVRTALRAPFFNLELHGIDLAHAEGDEIPPALVAKQPDLRRSLAYKLGALDETLTAARAAGARFARLDEVAGAFATSA
jgi:hypothetical protein